MSLMNTFRWLTPFVLGGVVSLGCLVPLWFGITGMGGLFLVLGVGMLLSGALLVASGLVARRASTLTDPRHQAGLLTGSVLLTALGILAFVATGVSMSFF
jgi:hypothetical protein